MPRPVALTVLRRRIDTIDGRILHLLNERASIALEVAHRKASDGTRVYAPGRERSVLQRLLDVNGGPLRGRDVRAIFTEIISASRGLEQRLRVAYLGPEATFTHLAARRRLGEAARYQSAATIGEVFAQVEAGRAELGVVPVENSTEGMVAHTLDLLVDSPLQICAEIMLPIRHCLLAKRGMTIARATRVVAHPQALAQCRRWIADRLPATPVEEETSNARAAQRAAAEHGTLAIGAQEAAAVYGLRVLEQDVQDEHANITRFVVLAHHDAEQPSGTDKTSVVVSVRDEVGVLARLLRPFATHGIDLIKIESRPLRARPWEYYFFLDLRGHRREARVRRALEAIDRRAIRMKVLGSYPTAFEDEP